MAQQSNVKVISRRSSQDISNQAGKGYAAMLWEQAKHGIQHSEATRSYGLPLTQDKLDCFNEEQIGQLHELMRETTKSKMQFDIVEETGQKR